MHKNERRWFAFSKFFVWRSSTVIGILRLGASAPKSWSTTTFIEKMGTVPQNRRVTYLSNAWYQLFILRIWTIFRNFKDQIYRELRYGKQIKIEWFQKNDSDSYLKYHVMIVL